MLGFMTGKRQKEQKQERADQKRVVFVSLWHGVTEP